VRNNHNLLVVLAVFLMVTTLAVISGYWLFYRTAYVLGGLVPLCFLWARVQARGLEVTIERPNDRLQVGQELEAKVHLRSRSMWTKLWLELQDQTDMPGRPAQTVLTLPAKRVRNWRVSMPCARRGLFGVGPVRVTTGDPFGLFRITREYGDRRDVMVLPQPEELPYFWAPAAHLPGEGAVRKRTHYVTPNAAAVREYHPGDSYNRIHWRTTARLGRLMVKTFEMDPTSNIWVVLDLDRAVQAGEGDESTEEYGVRIAASLAHHFLQANRRFGLMMIGREPAVLEPARGSQQYGRVLEELATARAGGRVPLARLLQDEGRRFGRQTTLIVITPSTDEEWALSLGQAVQSGARAAAVLLDAESFGRAANGRLPVESLIAANVVAYRVPARSDLALMLGPAGLEGNMPERHKAGVR
jgi:uncharacterized protein (DUF58 family)